MSEHSTERVFPEARKSRIVELVNTKKSITVPELCEMFSTSSVTIRNDLRSLERMGYLKRTHGGAILGQQVMDEKPSKSRDINIEEKKRIAKQALSLINDGDALVIDSGTTTLELVKLLSVKKRLTVVVNDVALALQLEVSSDATIVMAGGILRRGLHCTVGPDLTRTLSSLTVDKAIMGTNGLTQKGLSTPDIHQCEAKKAMMAIAREVIVLADSSKIGTSSFDLFATPAQFNTLITDSKADTEILHILEEQGVQIIIA